MLHWKVERENVTEVQCWSNLIGYVSTAQNDRLSLAHFHVGSTRAFAKVQAGVPTVKASYIDTIQTILWATLQE